jgi:hypothetical protein
MDETGLSVDLLEKMVEEAEARGVAFPRQWFYVITSILTWGLFWELADREQDNPHVQFLTWLIVSIALYVVCLC